MRNNGTISDLPDNVAIECNCIIGKNGAVPINIGHVETSIRGLIQQVKAYEELTIEAAVKGDYKAAIQALTINPFVNDGLMAKKVLKDLLEENKEYLPRFK